jgi:glutamyl-tRNA synthetase
MEITHVIRGDDHVSNTPRQLVLYRAFECEPPAFAHVPMILGDDGSRLSKRHGATSVSAYRDEGYLPSAVLNFLVLLGWSLDGEREMFSLADLEKLFDLERVGSNPAVFNLEKLRWMNGQYLKNLPEDERVAIAEEWLQAHGPDLRHRDATWRRAFIIALGERFRTLADIPDVGAFALAGEPVLDPDAWQSLLGRVEAGPRLRALADRIRNADAFDLEGLETATRGVAKELGIKAGELMGAARVALTGRTTAPGLFDVMWLLGREQTLQRLERAAGRWEEESVHARPGGLPPPMRDC